jgi:hypothetical protein
MKSISLSEWREWEVETIEQGGNEKAAQIWLAKFKSSQFSEPTSVEPAKVRDFIRQKYEEKKWWKQPCKDQDSSKPPARENHNLKSNGVTTGNEAKSCTTRSDPPQSRQDGEVGASRPVASSTVVAAGGWTADFSSAPPTTAPVSNPPPEVQWVADFSSEAVKIPATASNNGACHGINPSLLGLDFSITVPPAPKDELEARIAPVLAAVAEATTTRGDQLRHAVLNGSGDAVRRLYEESWHNPGPQFSGLPSQPPTQFFNIADDDAPYRRNGVGVPAPYVAPTLPAPTTEGPPRQLSENGGAVRIFDDDDIADNKNASQFDDLIHAFQEKNPVLGFDLL